MRSSLTATCRRAPFLPLSFRHVCVRSFTCSSQSLPPSTFHPTLLPSFLSSFLLLLPTRRGNRTCSDGGDYAHLCRRAPASLLFPDCFQATIRTTDNFPFVLADRVLFLGSICSRNIRIWGRQICDHSSLARCVGHSPFTFCLICCCVSDDNVRCFSQCLYYISALSTKGILKKVKRNSK